MEWDIENHTPKGIDDEQDSTVLLPSQRTLAPANTLHTGFEDPDDTYFNLDATAAFTDQFELLELLQQLHEGLGV